MRLILRTLLLPTLLGLGPGFAQAMAGEPVVVVHPESGIERLSRDEVVDLFLGRQKRLPSGAVALPVEQAQPPGLRARFYRLLVKKELPEISAYWARLFFSGQAQPPRQVDSAEEVLEWVSQNKGAIGVVDRTRVNRRVRIVLDLGALGPL